MFCYCYCSCNVSLVLIYMADGILDMYVLSYVLCQFCAIKYIIKLILSSKMCTQIVRKRKILKTIEFDKVAIRNTNFIWKSDVYVFCLTKRLCPQNKENMKIHKQTKIIIIIIIVEFPSVLLYIPMAMWFLVGELHYLATLQSEIFKYHNFSQNLVLWI